MGGMINRIRLQQHVLRNLEGQTVIPSLRVAVVAMLGPV